MRAILLLFFVFATFGGFLMQPQTAMAAPAICDFFYVTPQVVAPGDPITLNWETTDATSVFIDNGVGAVAVDGTTGVNAPGAVGEQVYEMTLTYTAYGVERVTSCAASVQVVAAITPTTPVCDFFYASPANGNPSQPSTVFWETTNATQVELNTAGIQPLDGSFGVDFDSVAGYFASGLDISNFDGVSTTTAFCNAELNIFSPTALRFAPSVATVAPGGDFDLEWDVFGTSVITIFDDDGAEIYFEFFPTSNDADSLSLTAPVATGTYSYVLQMYEQLSEGDAYVYATSTVTVGTVAPSLPICNAFTATPATFVGSGTTTLNWDIGNTETVNIDNGLGLVDFTTIGPSNLVGSLDVFVSANTTFELTATNPDGSTLCSAAVSVTDPEPQSSSGGSSGTKVPQPQCVFFKASADDVIEGAAVTLSFETKNADLVTIYEGKVSDNKIVYKVAPGASKAGAAAVTVSKDSTFTLVAEKGRRSDECSTSVAALDPFAFGGAGRNEAGILLTEVPETGYEMSFATKIMLYVMLASGTLFVLFMVMHVGRLGIFATQSTVKYGRFTPISAAADHALRVHRTRSLLVIAALVVCVVLLGIQLL